MVVVLADQLRFFVRVTVSFAIGRAVGLAVGEAVLIGTNIAIGFSWLSL